MLIRSYGTNWNIKAVDRGSVGPRGAGTILGVVRFGKKDVNVDVWDQRGVYFLEKEFKVVYVGKAEKTNLGSRMRTHLDDEYAGRWDSFTWFGVNSFNKNGTMREFSSRNVSLEDVVKTLEAFGILVTDAPLNSRNERFPGATIVKPRIKSVLKTDRQYLDEILESVHKIQKRMPLRFKINKSKS